jgi:hypothetical protein
LTDEPKSVYEVRFIERKESLQLDKCSRARKPVACCSVESWGLYGHFNSGLGGFFSLAMDSRAFLGELACFVSYWGRGNNLESILLISPVADLSDPVSPHQGAEMQFTTPSRDAGTIVLSMGGWDTHSSRIPRYATLARPLFMLLLIFLFGPKIINALSRSYSTGPMDQTPALSQGTLTSAYAEPSITFYRGPWRLHRSTPATSTTSPIPPLPYYLHIAAR